MQVVLVHLQNICLIADDRSDYINKYVPVIVSLYEFAGEALEKFVAGL